MDPLTEDRRWLVLAALLISAATATLIEVARTQVVLQPLELLGYDLGLTLRPGATEPTPITIVEINETDIQALGSWPVSDRALAQALVTATGAGASVIGIDIYRDVPVPPGTAELEAQLGRHANLIGIFKFPSPEAPGVAANPTLAEADQVGFSDLVLDADAVVRRGLFFMDDGSHFESSFPLKVTLTHLARTGVHLTPDPERPEFFRIGASRYVPLPARYGGYAQLDNAGYQFLLDYARAPDDFPRLGFSALLDGTAPEALLRDRVVLIGVNAESVKDSFVTPASHWPWSEAPQVPGIALHAMVIDQLLRAARTSSSGAPAAWRPGAELMLIFLMAAGGAATALFAGTAMRLLLVIVAGCAASTAIGLVLFYYNRWLPVLPISLAWAMAAALTTAYLVQRTRREREALQRILSLQVSPAVAEEIWRRREELLTEGRLRPQQLTATVMFADLKGFTRLTEELPSDELLEWLDPIMKVATDIVIEHGGMLDDYFGDGIKANFGVPIRRQTEGEIASDAGSAVRCAEALIRASERLNEQSARPYVWRFGIHTGTVVAASVGSSDRSKYTTVGDTVNVAARLESLAKDQAAADTAPPQGPIIVSAETASLLRSDRALVKLGDVALRGRQQAIEAFRLSQPVSPVETITVRESA